MISLHVVYLSINKNVYVCIYKCLKAKDQRKTRRLGLIFSLEVEYSVATWVNEKMNFKI